jgi:hypothetical protein
MALDKMKSTVIDKLAKPKPHDTQDDLWTMLKDKYDLGMELRRPWEQRWLINLAFFVGKQYIFFNHSANIIQQLREVKGRIRNVDNKLLPRVLKKVSREIRNPPEMSVVPRTNDQEDIDAARMGDKVLKAWWKNNGMPSKYRKLAMWRGVCGTAFLADKWNRKSGPIERDEKTGKLVYAGDADVEILGPFGVLVPYATLGDDEINEFPWLMIVRVKPLEWFRKNFDRGDEVKAEQVPVQYFETQQLFGMNALAGQERLERARHLELFIQPSYEYPKGLHIQGANSIILEKDDYPYDEYAVEPFRDIYVPGVFWGVSTLEQAIPLQKTWNRTISSFDEFNRVLGKGKGLVPKGSELEALPDDTHGEWLSYKPVMGHKPEIMQLKSLPDTYDKLLNITAVGIEDLFSQHEVSRGTNKSDIRSGYMVSLLLEQDTESMVPSGAEAKDGFERCMSRILRRIKEGYTSERLLSIRGAEGQYEIFSFEGAQLRDNTDVSVVKDLAVPDSRTAREAMIIDKFQTGLYGDPADPEVRRQVLQMLEDAAAESTFTEVRLDEQNAKYENIAIAQGGISQMLVNTYDNHPVHMKEHNRFRKTRRYQQLKMTDPQKFLEIEQLFEEHNRFHSKLYQEQVGAAAQELPAKDPAGSKRPGNVVPMGGRV